MAASDCGNCKHFKPSMSLDGAGVCLRLAAHQERHERMLDYAGGAGRGGKWGRGMEWAVDHLVYETDGGCEHWRLDPEA